MDLVVGWLSSEWVVMTLARNRRFWGTGLAEMLNGREGCVMFSRA